MDEEEKKRILKILARKLEEYEIEELERQYIVKKRIFNENELNLLIKSIKKDIKNRKIKKIDVSFDIIFIDEIKR